MLPEPLPGAVIGAVAADYLSGLLPACAVLAVLAAVLRPAGARLVVWAGVAAMALAGAWSATNSVVMKIWHPVATVQMAHMAAFWGGAAFWAAIFVAVPLALAGLSVLP